MTKEYFNTLEKIIQCICFNKIFTIFSVPIHTQRFQVKKICSLLHENNLVKKMCKPSYVFSVHAQVFLENFTTRQFYHHEHTCQIYLSESHVLCTRFWPQTRNLVSIELVCYIASNWLLFIIYIHIFNLDY